MKLYDIQEQYRAWLNKVEEQDGELTEADLAELDNNETDFKEKANNYAGLILTLEAEAEALTEAGKKQLARAKAKTDKAEFLRARLTTACTERGVDKLETLNAVISFRRSQSVQISDESKLPKEFIKTVEKADTAAIRAALISGKTVDGAELIENKNIQVK